MTICPVCNLLVRDAEAAQNNGEHRRCRYETLNLEIDALEDQRHGDEEEEE